MICELNRNEGSEGETKQWLDIGQNKMKKIEKSNFTAIDVE